MLVIDYWNQKKNLSRLSGSLILHMNRHDDIIISRLYIVYRTKLMHIILIMYHAAKLLSNVSF